MKEFEQRIKNLAENIKVSSGLPASETANALFGISKEISEYTPPGVTKEDVKSIEQLTDSVNRFCDMPERDGLNDEFIEAIQKAQKLILIRAGGRTFAAFKDKFPEDTESPTE